MASTQAFPGVVGIDVVAARYGLPSEKVQQKKIAALDDNCRAFIAASPFVLLATTGADGTLDVSPRGGHPGFVRVIDGRRIVIPDAPGNRLVDSLSNIAETGAVGLLFLLPRRGETLRVNGRACISDDRALRDLATEEGRAAPPFVVGVEVEETFLHCAKAFIRSGLWEPERWADADAVPASARIFADHLALDEAAVQQILEEGYTTTVRWGDPGEPLPAE